MLKNVAITVVLAIEMAMGSTCDLAPAILNAVWTYDFSYTKSTGAVGIQRKSTLRYKLTAIQTKHDTIFYSFVVRDSGMQVSYNKSDSIRTGFDTVITSTTIETAGTIRPLDRQPFKWPVTPFYHVRNAVCGTTFTHNGVLLNGTGSYWDSYPMGSGGGTILYAEDIGLVSNHGGMHNWSGDTLKMENWQLSLTLFMKKGTDISQKPHTMNQSKRPATQSSTPQTVDLLGRRVNIRAGAAGHQTGARRLLFVHDAKTGEMGKEILRQGTVSK